MLFLTVVYISILSSEAQSPWLLGANGNITPSNLSANVGIGLFPGSTFSAKFQVHNGDINMTSDAAGATRTLSSNTDAGSLSFTTKGTNGSNSGPSIDLYGTSGNWRAGNIYFHARAPEGFPSWGQAFRFLNFNPNNGNWTEMMTMLQQGGKTKIIIGSGINVNGDYALYVERGIVTEKLKVAVKTSADWSDYVFKPDYELRTLSELRSFISENGHLPDIPSAEEVVKEGVDVGQMNAMLLRKVEELTLYVLDLQSQIESIKKAPVSKAAQTPKP